MLRRDCVDRVVHGPLDHAHVDLRCRRCSACRLWKAGQRVRRNEVPLRHRTRVCSGWRRGRCADGAEYPYQDTDGHRDDRN